MTQNMTGRRMTDELENLTDHDLLITHSVNIKMLCKLVEDNNKTLDDFIKKIDLRCETTGCKIEDIKDKSINSTTAKWAVGIIFIVLLSVISTLGINQVMIMKNSTDIKHNTILIQDVHKTLDKHIDKFDKPDQ